MGLDMYAFTTSQDIPHADFKHPPDSVQFFYWRKHPDLHGWMEQIYFKRGGQHKDFNLSPVRLDLVHLQALEQALRDEELPEATGFFFGESGPEERERDFEFLNLAREAHKAGKRIFYTSWW
jgi:hypothetical protein